MTAPRIVRRDGAVTLTFPFDAWLVDAAYRCLARLHHPDRGGSTVMMQAINAAAEQIRSAS